MINGCRWKSQQLFRCLWNPVKLILSYGIGHLFYSLVPSALVFYCHSICHDPLKTQWAAQGMLFDWLMDRVPYLQRLSCNWTTVCSFYACKYFSSVYSICFLYRSKFLIFSSPSYNPNEFFALSCFPEWDNGWYLWQWVTHGFISLDSKAESETWKPPLEGSC